MDKTAKKELATSAVKTLFSNIPYIGGLLNEVIYDYRGRIKQERLNQFSLLLAEYFEVHPLVDTVILTSEDFGDLFESVLKRVALTRSEDKHRRFRDILTNYLQHPCADIDDTELFLDLVSQLHEMAILILQKHLVFDEDYAAKRESRRKLFNEICAHGSDNPIRVFFLFVNVATHQRKIRELDEQLKQVDVAGRAVAYAISEEHFLYYQQVLFARGLLAQKFIKNPDGWNTDTFSYTVVTELGRKFLEFIKSEVLAI